VAFIGRLSALWGVVCSGCNISWNPWRRAHITIQCLKGNLGIQVRNGEPERRNIEPGFWDVSGLGRYAEEV